MKPGPTGGAIGIVKEQWQVVNPHRDTSALFEEDHGTDRYLASLDVFHQLHCVVSCRDIGHLRPYQLTHIWSIFYVRALTVSLTTKTSPAAVVESHPGKSGRVSVHNCICTFFFLLTLCAFFCLRTFRWNALTGLDVLWWYLAFDVQLDERYDMLYPNFNTVHMCKKWNTLTKWNMSRGW